MFNSSKVTATILVLFGLAACQTIEGAGRDIEDAGQAISSASEEAQQ
ncbi:entericidin A/B family lipoprotein [Donghicola sp. XS_ASV15]